MNKTVFGLMAFLFLFSMVAKAQSVSGDWKGTLSVQGINLELIFHISDKDGVYTSTMDVPAQGATGIPVEKTEFANNKLSMSVPAAKIMFSGELTGDSIAGNFEQMGTKLPLTLRKFKSKLPGNTALVTSDETLKQLAAFDAGNYKYKVADYFARPKASSFRLSPNGKYMSYLEKDDKNKNHVYVKEIATGKVNRAIEEKDELIKGYGWISDEKLYYMMDKGGNENFHIYATNIDGTNASDLTPFEGVRAGIISVLKDQKNIIIFQMNKNNKQIFEPYRLNAATGEITQLFENKDAANSIQSYEFDKD